MYLKNIDTAFPLGVQYSPVGQSGVDNLTSFG